MDDSYYRVQRGRKDRRSLSRLLKFKSNNTLSFISSGQKCKCGREHNSINTLGDNMEIIDREVCPFMYNVRNACVRAVFGNHIPKVDSKLLQDVSRGD